jgi:UDP-glucose 4-epimerase
MNQAQTILVTGGAGYIGSHIILSLQREGYKVVVLDNLIYGHREFVDTVLKVPLVIGDLAYRPLLDRLFKTHDITAVMHFAAYAYVGESVGDPAKYYRNNVLGTLTLLEAMIAANVKKIVFSSTCATYGVPDIVPILENHPQRPINPYGASKLMVERILRDFDRAYGLKSLIFRYFNAAGASAEANLGEDHDPEPHLIPLVLLTALGKRKAIAVYGTDYPTPDGTCIRDYIHVTDLAQAHHLGLRYLLAENRSDIFNLGNGCGFSVREVIETARTITGREIPVIEGDRRIGDPPILVGSGERARTLLGWQPQHHHLSTIIADAWRWHQKRHGTLSP